jgi:serine/threonine protein kinase
MSSLQFLETLSSDLDVVLTQDNNEVVVKSGNFHSLEREYMLLKTLGHHSAIINPILLVKNEEGASHLMLPYYRNGSIASVSPLSEEDAIYFFQQMVLVADQLKRNGIVHNNLCSSNFLVDESDRIVLTGFDLATSDRVATYYSNGKAPPRAPSSKGSVSTRTLNELKTVYQLGACLFGMLFGTSLYEERGDALCKELEMVEGLEERLAREGKQSRMCLGEKTRELLIGCLDPDHTKRSSLRRLKLELM